MHRRLFTRRIRVLTLMLIIGLIAVTGLIPAGHSLAQDGDSTTPPLPATFRLNVNANNHIYQGWNNCGPATLTMSLTYFGHVKDQQPAATFLKPNGEDKNVSPWEMVDYVNEAASATTNVKALYRPGGNMELLRRLLANNFPVVIEKGYEPEGYEWMGHYLFLIGYDNNDQVFLTYDSFSGHGNYQGLRESYDYIEHYWEHFGNTFIVIYQPEREEELLELLGELADLDRAYQIQAQNAQVTASEEPENGWAWFNIGDALTHLGQYQQATDYFRVAFQKNMPWRTLWYRHTPFEAFYQTGDFETVLRMVQNTKLTTPYVEELHYYHGMVFASQGRPEDARAQFNQALRYNSNYDAAREALNALNEGNTGYFVTSQS
jgi:tetratricopeptide (TPR) repeat protein